MPACAKLVYIMQFHVLHETRYDYGQKVHFSPHFLYLHPREDQLLHLTSYELTLSPGATVQWMRDDCDNVFASVQFTEEAASLVIRSEFVVRSSDEKPLAVEVRDYAKSFPFSYEPLHVFNLAAYLIKPSAETQATLQKWLDEHFTDRPAETLPYLYALNECLHKTLKPFRRDEEGIQPSTATLAANAGACRDYAVLLIEMLRTLGLAARFVSGYYFDPAVSNTPAAAMHAWAEVYVPGAGWKGLDPTTGLFCHDAYVPIAHAAVAASVNPIQGSYITTLTGIPKLSIQVLMEKIEIPFETVPIPLSA